MVSTNRPRGGENPLTTGVKQAVPTAPVARPGICRFPLNKIKNQPRSKSGGGSARAVFLLVSQSKALCSSHSVIVSALIIKFITKPDPTLFCERLFSSFSALRIFWGFSRGFISSQYIGISYAARVLWNQKQRKKANFSSNSRAYSGRFG